MNEHNIEEIVLDAIEDNAQMVASILRQFGGLGGQTIVQTAGGGTGGGTGTGSILEGAITGTGSYTHANGSFAQTFTGSGNWKWQSATDSANVKYNQISVLDTANTESFIATAKDINLITAQDVNSMTITTDAITPTVAQITANSITTGIGLNVSMNGLTTGQGLYVQSSAAHTGALAEVIDSGAQTGETFKVTSSGLGSGLYIDKNANGRALIVDTVATTATALDVIATTMTTGTVLNMAGLDALTTGTALNLVSNSADTGTRTLVNIENQNALADAAEVVKISQAGDEVALNITDTGNGKALEITSSATTAQPVIDIIAQSVTTGHILRMINADALTTGTMALFSSSSTSTAARDLVSINNGTGANTTPLHVSTNADNHLISLSRSVGVSAGSLIRFSADATLFQLMGGAGTGEAVLTADKGSLNMDSLNANLEIKTTDTVNTGWANFMISKVTAEGAPPTFAWGSLHPVNVSGAAQTLVVPALATIKAGDYFSVTDSRESAAANNITVDFTTNGFNLHGSSQNASLNVNASSATFIYVSAAVGFIMQK